MVLVVHPGSGVTGLHLIVTILNQILLHLLQGPGPGESHTVGTRPKLLMPRCTPPRASSTEGTSTSGYGAGLRSGCMAAGGPGRAATESRHGRRATWHKAKPGPTALHPQEWEGFPVTSTRRASTHQVLHVHAAPVAQLLDNTGSGVPPVRAELHLCALSRPLSAGPTGLVPGVPPPSVELQGTSHGVGWVREGTHLPQGPAPRQQPWALPTPAEQQGVVGASAGGVGGCVGERCEVWAPKAVALSASRDELRGRQDR